MIIEWVAKFMPWQVYPQQQTPVAIQKVPG